MKTFFVTFAVWIALVAWFTGAAILAVWVGATFGEDWKFVPVTLGLAPVVSGIIWFIWFIVEGT